MGTSLRLEIHGSFQFVYERIELKVNWERRKRLSVTSVLELVLATEDTETELSLESATDAGSNSHTYIGLTSPFLFGNRSAKQFRQLSCIAQPREEDFLSHPNLFL